MEFENKYASRGVGNTALGLSIGAVAAELLGGGALGNIFGGNRNCVASEDHHVNRYELGLQQQIASKDARIGLLESNIYTDAKIADVYERLNIKINSIENQICQQNVYNATLNGAVSCIQTQIAQLQGLTKVIIPSDNICPQPMPLYNNWVAPAATGTTGA